MRENSLFSGLVSTAMETNNSEGLSAIDNIESLIARNSELEARVAELSEHVAQQPGPVLKCGYLYKYRPWARLFEKPWELRFFSLSGNVLSFWRSETDAGQHPRGSCPLDGCVINVEGMKRNRYFTFRIDDGSGGALLRLSTGNEADGRHWVSLLGTVGCPICSEEDRNSYSEGDRSSGVTANSTHDAAAAEDTGTSTGPRSGPHRDGLKKRILSTTSAGPGGGSLSDAMQTDPPPPSDEKEPLRAEQNKHQSTRHMLRAASPAHRKPKGSPLSSDAIFDQSHGGLFNMCIVLLLAVNSRLIIENLMKYGILMRTGFWINGSSIRDWPLLLTGLSMAVFPVASLLIEKLKIHTAVTEKVVGVLHAVNVTATFMYPAFVIYRTQAGPLGGFVLIFIVVITWMKLISYAHTNADVRAMLASGEKPELAMDAPVVQYPDNITVRNMLYFLFAPTLCYQLGYPRSRHVRKGWVFRQLLVLVVFMGLMLFIIEQYINPTIQNSQHPLKGHFMYSIERVLKLSIPTLYVWLCMFYCFFHLWLNIVAEVLCFGDREFYRDWWNAKTIEEPVHRWMVRHVYFPCLRHGISKPLAMLIVFTLSAVFHEVVVGVPCHMVRLWAFLGIVFQVPLVVLTNYLYRKFKKPAVGNMLFWFFFCIVGQPICVLLYYHDVQVNWQQEQAGVIG
eukprot:jgi/Mesen1/2606/ME000166S01728